MGGGRRLQRVCQAANAMALRAASDVSSCEEVGILADALKQNVGECIGHFVNSILIFMA